MAKEREHRLRVLHISDLHVRGPRETEAWRRRRVLGEAWERNLDDLVKDGIPIDLVCFTGDVADHGTSEEYGPATEFVEATLGRLHVPKERFFVVPGNHDIHRRTNQAAWKKLRSLLFDVPAIERSRWLQGGKAPRGLRDKQREQILERGAAFRTWLSSIGREALLPDRSPHGRLGYRVRVPGLPFDVQVIGLDSAWLCGDNADSGSLLLTEGQVARLATDEHGKTLSGFRLALMHHPLTDLADADSCRDLLAEHVDLVLRGHLHREEIAAWVGPGQILRQVAAGCLYEGSLGNTWRNACHLFDVTVDAAGRPKRYDVRLRGFSDRQAGFWFDDGSLYAEAPNGRLTWMVRPPSEPPPPPSTRGRVFVGRREELQRIAEALLPSAGERKPAAICAVQGMPGVGKSYLAEQFRLDRASDFPGGAVLVALQPEEGRAAEPLSTALLGDIADQLSLRAPPEEMAARVRDRLRVPLTLLRVENVDSEAAAGAVVRLARWLRDCPMIVTGRYKGLGNGAGWARVPVPEFDEPTALEQLEAELPPERVRGKREELRRLVRELGRLPLALHLAAGYLREGGYDAGTFLDELRRSGFDLDPNHPDDRLSQEDPRRANLHRTFSLSLALLGRQLGADANVLVAGLRALGHAPLGGFGRSLGEALAGLSAVDFARLMNTAGKLSLVMPAEEREDDAWRIHPLLAEWLRWGADEAAVLARMTEWFVERLRAKAEQPWKEVTCEAGTLSAWLERVRGEDVARVERAGSQYAILNGPFHVWMAFCTRGLGQRTDPKERSGLLWTLANVARSAGAMDSALEAAEQKWAVDRDRGDERGTALAMDCRADILEGRGQLDEALRIRREELLPVFERLGDVRSHAVTLGKIAGIAQARGRPDEALRIRQEEELPVYERLGDVRSRAMTLGKIADIVQARGQLEEALRIRREELLPVYERIGDVRSRARTLRKIADIFEARGQLDEALRIRREEELPVFERLGEVRERAVTLGRIIDIAQARGQLDEALRMRQEEELPVYERLGDVRSRAMTLGKIADIFEARGQLDEALRIRREEELPVYERLGDVRSRAMTLGQIADIFKARGQLDEALRIRREEELPVHERLGDVHSRAMTLGKIADIFEARGQLDEALRIRREEELPVYERLGDARSRAMTLRKIADIAQVRGQFDDALRMYREELLPVFEQLGDVRSRAMTLGRIADVAQIRGQLDEALRIYREELLPVFERLGDVRSRAMTLGRIADIAQAKGQLDEALRIRREELLPVFKQLGDVHSRAVTLGKIADVAQVRGQLDEALRICREELLPVFEQLGDVRSRAMTLGRIADVAQVRGQLDEALRIRREEQLPVFERLGATRDVLITRVKVALNLLARNAAGDRRDARGLLELAYAGAVGLGIPEADQIRRIQQHHGLLS
ncbi:metallophosphoesterase [Sorangium sp. So ce296]|uniref:metallophosphoesterase n=1 Tax=Sorangium sp. So ce296 TaxID=3133296 RepID=UPI003F63BF5E